MAEKKRTPEDVSTDIQNLNEVYDHRRQLLQDEIEKIRTNIKELDDAYSDALTNLNREFEQLKNTPHP